MPNNAIQSLRTLNAAVDVATDNTLQSLVCATTSTGSATRRTDRVVQKQTLAPFHEGHKSSADEDRDDCHCSNTNTVLSMTDINVLILVGLRAASINRELAKVAVDSSALATRIHFVYEGKDLLHL